MTNFSPGDVAFEGFRVTRERPRVVLIWAVFHLLVSFASATALIMLGGEAFLQADNAADMSTEELAVFMRDMAPAYLVLAPIGLMVVSVSAAAVYRLHLRPQEAVEHGHLRFGADEVRLMLLTLVYYLLVILGVLALSVVAAVAAALASMAGQGAMTLTGVGMMLFFAGVGIYVLVRLSLAPVLTFQHRRLVVFGSWAVTRGHFWRLLGAYLLALIMVVVISLLMMVIFAALAGIATVALGGSLESVGEAFQPDFSSFAAYISVQTILYLIFNALLTAIYYPAILTPQVIAYQAFGVPPDRGIGSDAVV